MSTSMILRSISTSVVPVQRTQLFRLWTRSFLPALAFKPSIHLFANAHLLPATRLSYLLPTTRFSYSTTVFPHNNEHHDPDYSPLTASFDLPDPLRPSTSSPADDPSVAVPTPATDEHFEFITAASWHPKYRKDKAQLSVPYWKHIQVGKVDAGEDAFFHTSTPKGLALGVADGVGGWADVGVDPSLFSWTLMNNAASIAKDIDSLDAQQILDGAFTELVNEGKVIAGSSTACILGLCKATGRMTSSNLGDSAFILIRGRKVIYESPSQQHFFNCPYQLTVIPDNYPDRSMYIRDKPQDAQRGSFTLQDGDLILLATDGFFDNVYAHEALAIVNNELDNVEIDPHHLPTPADSEPRTNVEETEDMILRVRNLCRRLTDTARRFSLDPKRMSPWAVNAREHGGRFQGGKQDDITCIVTFVRNINLMGKE